VTTFKSPNPETITNLIIREFGGLKDRRIIAKGRYALVLGRVMILV
jgi:hypothetical protein